MKTCFKCLVSKELSEFYAHAAMTDGLLGKCKECTRRDVKESRARNIERVLAYDRKRSRDPERIRSSREACKRAAAADPERYKGYKRQHAERHPERVSARQQVATAVRYGRLVKTPCVVCGDPKSQGHHEDYSKPMEVVWLCTRHHMERHRKLDEIAAMLEASSSSAR